MLSSQVLPLLAQAVSVTFLSLLLILAGDVEVNPGPGKGKERAASGLFWKHCGSVCCGKLLQTDTQFK